ncbi:MAG: FeoA family protein [Eubacteriaceae bacterium]
MSVAMMLVGETRQIAGFKGKDKMRQHLQNLGFTKGQAIRILGENASGLILQVKDTKIALNRGLAELIIVS